LNPDESFRLTLYDTASEALLHKSGAVRSFDWIFNYHWGAGLVVTGRVRYIGQKVIESSFSAVINSSPSYFHIFFLVAFF
jgi:hypothetical protein